jgi:mRNA-degrading endonuclease RelE of RelBE toxin-antitoxin system
VVRLKGNFVSEAGFAFKRLANHERTYRLRVGNWRVLFDVFEEVSIISNDVFS